MAKSRNKPGAEGETAKKAPELSATPERAIIITVPQDQSYFPSVRPKTSMSSSPLARRCAPGRASWLSISTRSPVAHDELGASRAQRLLLSPEPLKELLVDAARIGRANMIPAVSSAGIDRGAHAPKEYTALILANYHGSLGTTQALLDVEVPDLGRANPSPLGVGFKGFGAIRCVLLAASADANRRNRAGQTAMMMAAMFGHAEIFKDLIAVGTDIECTDAPGNSTKSLDCSRNNAAIVLLDIAAPSVKALDG